MPKGAKWIFGLNYVQSTLTIAYRVNGRICKTVLRDRMSCATL